jgi:hypothetical protein
MNPSKPGSGEAKAAQLIENPTTIADMLHNGLTIGVLRHEDHEGLEKLYRDRDEAHKRGDWELLRMTVDFPTTIVSDSADGEAIAYSFEEAEFRERAANAMRLVPRAPVDHNRRFIFLSDHLAINLEENSVKVGEETLRFKAAHLVIRKDGRWKVKTVVEGGWAKAYKLTRAFQDR